MQLDRQPDREAQIAHKYARGGSQVQAMRKLVKLAHRRAMPGPVTLADDRSLAGELIEELADGINYATWGVLAGQIPEDRAAQICGHLAEAYRLAAGVRN